MSGMLRGFTLLALLASLAFACAAVAGNAEPDALFAQAAEAYNEGRYADALERYRQVQAQGYIAPALYYNMANAYFQQGEVARAILHYRRAWQLAPRDAEIAANLDFALQRAAALAPTSPFHRRAVYVLSRGEWAIAALAAYWVLGFGLVLYLLGRGPRILFARIAAASAVVLGLCAYPLWVWKGLDRNPELVLLEAEQAARFAPLADAPAHFQVPRGSIVRETQRQGGWVEVESERKKGWLPAEALARVNVAEP